MGAGFFRACATPIAHGVISYKEHTQGQLNLRAALALAQRTPIKPAIQNSYFEITGFLVIMDA